MAFECEWFRLSTFFHWKRPDIDHKMLARYGFFYSGEDDLVKCTFCMIEVRDWLPEHNVLQRHIQLKPNCCLIRRCPTMANVPIGSEEEFNNTLPPVSSTIVPCDLLNQFKIWRKLVIKD